MHIHVHVRNIIRGTFSLTLCYAQVLEGAYFLHDKGVGEETQVSYQTLAQSLEEFIGKTFNDWAAGVDRELQRLLEVPLMSKHSSRCVCVCVCLCVYVCECVLVCVSVCESVRVCATCLCSTCTCT